MQMTFRWYGSDDPVTLEKIRQVPGVTGIVSALYDVPVGEVWPIEKLEKLKATIEAHGLELAVIESIPVHEDIKLGRPTRDRLIDNYAQSIRHMGQLGIPVLCYNFMPVFDWTRTDLAMAMPDSSTVLCFDEEACARIDLSNGTGDLPGWATAYTAEQLRDLVQAYKQVGEDQLWANLEYFLKRVVPVAEEFDVRMAIHPDDPPWPIFDLPRIVTDGAAFERITKLVDSPANGLTLCTGSLGAAPSNDVPAIIRRVGKRINFAHFRNVKITGKNCFHESEHPSRFGSVDMLACTRALHEVGFTGPMRPDHGRMIWNETGRPGYGLHDRALGAMYLQGLWEAVSE